MSFLVQKRSKILLQNENTDTKISKAKEPDNFYYKEIALLTCAGGWSVNFEEKSSFLDSESRRILEIPEEYRPSLRTALDFYAPEHKEKAAGIFMECSQGHPFTTTIKMQTYNDREFWVRATGKPIYNDLNEVVGLRGVFQDINIDKIKELRLLKSLKIIELQNTKLNNFAKIITHSLRSHSSNLQMALELLKDTEDPDEKEELCDGLNEISENLATTIGHLTELSIIQGKTAETKEVVGFDAVLEQVKNKLRNTLLDTRTEIYTDFTEIPEIMYIPSYLESILQNLITNAIKYKSPERSPVIEIYSYTENEEKFLMVKDNGMGIDLEKYGNRIFNIYQTFHTNKDSEGVGLFLIKNKIESLQGTISVNSRVDSGTTFTIRF